MWYMTDLCVCLLVTSNIFNTYSSIGLTCLNEMLFSHHFILFPYKETYHFFWQMIIAVIYCLNDSLNMLFTCLFTFIRFNHGRWLRNSAERKLTWMWRAIQVTRPYTSCRRRAGRTVWWNCCVGERIQASETTMETLLYTLQSL